MNQQSNENTFEPKVYDTRLADEELDAVSGGNAAWGAYERSGHGAEPDAPQTSQGVDR